MASVGFHANVDLNANRVVEVADPVAAQDAATKAYVDARVGAGAELAHAEITADVTISAATEATAQTVVSAGAVTFDGTSKVRLEFYTPSVSIPTVTALFLILHDGTNSLGWLCGVSNAAGTNENVVCHAVRVFTPAAGTRTYSIRGYRTASNVSIKAGAGGVGVYLPGFLRLTT